MDKNNKYKFVFKFAQDFLNKIIADHPGLDNSVLERHLQPEAKFDSIQDAQCRLVQSLSNRSMMASVIGFDRREKTIKPILFGYDAKKNIVQL